MIQCVFSISCDNAQHATDTLFIKAAYTYYSVYLNDTKITLHKKHTHTHLLRLFRELFIQKLYTLTQGTALFIQISLSLSLTCTRTHTHTHTHTCIHTHTVYTYLGDSTHLTSHTHTHIQYTYTQCTHTHSLQKL